MMVVLCLQMARKSFIGWKTICIDAVFCNFFPPWWQCSLVTGRWVVGKRNIPHTLFFSAFSPDNMMEITGRDNCLGSVNSNSTVLTSQNTTIDLISYVRIIHCIVYAQPFYLKCSILYITDIFLLIVK